MKRLRLLLLLALPLAVSACDVPGCTVTTSQETKRVYKPKPWYKSWHFWGPTIAEVGLGILDTESSPRLRGVCPYPYCGESNPIFFSENPSRKRMYALGAVYTAASRGLVAAIWTKDEKYGIATSYMSLGVKATLHGFAIGHNYGIQRIRLPEDDVTHNASDCFLPKCR